ncbi:zinc-dependent alcohol dehydrogenase [Cohnella abietis]|uniref:Galactitol-1-phosphate 5-dehydrogenase n=1 Tax=Cohnella abietis TaxID=2507935 RepID=A0A3T1DAA2_9BACL|nr:alcohol dehydrogenase catalytic domain-containing protein [Cohnella abietis]BBI35032.1 galactitol-1-phosphate 5-dehydrogenase [Cohnella abietis]
MKALVYEGPHNLTLQIIDMPEVQAGEVLLKVEAVGICGSELEGYLGHSSIRTPPLIMGHEFCGRVAETPPGHSTLNKGDLVVVNPLLSCGKCDRCLLGQPNVCRSRAIVGIHRPGAFAQFVAVPISSITKLPSGMKPEIASLAEPLAVCIHALKLAYRPFDNLLIFGAGPIGLLTMQAAKQMGAGAILVTDKQPQRLVYPARYGAHIALPEQLDKEVSETFGHKGIDLIIDCVGIQGTRHSALSLINSGGTIVMVGLGQDETTLPLNHLVRQEVTLKGAYTYTDEDFNHAVQLLVEGCIQTEEWMGLKDLEEGPEQFKALCDQRSEYSKIVLMNR